MTHAPKQLVALLAMAGCVVLSLGGPACASRGGGQSPAPAARVRQAVTLQVHNANWSEVRIYIVRLSMPLRLGTVTSGSSALFQIPPDFLGNAGDVYVVAVPLAGTAVYRAPLIGVTYGDFVELTVENLLQHSYLVVR